MIGIYNSYQEIINSCFTQVEKLKSLEFKLEIITDPNKPGELSEIKLNFEDQIKNLKNLIEFCLKQQSKENLGREITR